jgi:hypothetical protein
MTAKTIRFSQLSPARQTLVQMCQALNFGQIQGLRLREAEPVLNPPPVVLVETRLDLADEPRPEIQLKDFELPDELRRLMARLDEIKEGTIERLEVRAGIPRRLVVESRLGSPERRPTAGEEKAKPKGEV